MMRLNVGSGDKLRDDAINMDIRHIPGAIRGDIRAIPYGDSFFDEIYATDVIEHLIPTEADKALKEIDRVLKDDGKVFFQLPCLKGILEQYIKGAPAEKVSWWLFGGQDYKENYHYAVYSERSFERALNKAGMKSISFEQDITNMKITAVKIKGE